MEPSEGLPRTRARDPEMPTGVVRSLDQLDSLNANRLDPLTADFEALPEPPPYKKERLFSRKVMIGWAVATLLVWFAISFITPIVVETVRAEVESRMEPPTDNTAIPAPVVEPVAPVIAEPAVPAEPPQPAKPAPPKK